MPTTQTAATRHDSTTSRSPSDPAADRSATVAAMLPVTIVSGSPAIAPQVPGANAALPSHPQVATSKVGASHGGRAVSVRGWIGEGRDISPHRNPEAGPAQATRHRPRL